MFALVHSKIASGSDGYSNNLDHVLSGKFGLRECRTWRSGTVATAHRLLPLVPEDVFDRQPLTSTDGRHTLVGDIRLNDRPDLEAALGFPRKQAETLADSDLVLAAWRRWGDAAPEHLAGDFAIAIHDHDAATTHLVLDHLGNRTLFYAWTDNGLVVASSVPALLAMPAVDQEVNLRFVAGFLIDDPSLVEQTAFTKIHRVPHGTIMRFGSTGLERRWCYWDFDPTRRVKLARDEDYVDQARELLDRSVRNSARVSGALVGTLTAGYDSSSVIGTLAKVRPGVDIQAMTMAPPQGVTGLSGLAVDETTYAARTAAHWPQVHHNILRFQERQSRLWESPEEYFVASGSPLRNWQVYAWYVNLWAEVRRRGASALFVGAFGNAGLSYDGIRSLSNWMRQGRFLKTTRELRMLSRHPEAEWPGSLRAVWLEGIRPMAPDWLRRGVEYWRGTKTWPPDLRSSLLSRRYFFDQNMRQDIEAGMGNSHRDGPGDAYKYRSVWFTMARYRRTDAYEAARYLSGTTVIPPLLERHLMEFCLAIPLDQYLRDGQPRFLARRVLADRVPASVFEPLPVLMQGGDLISALNLHRDLFASVLEDVEKGGVA